MLHDELFLMQVRPPCIPTNALKRKAAMDTDDEPKRKLVRIQYIMT